MEQKKKKHYIRNILAAVLAVGLFLGMTPNDVRAGDAGALSEKPYTIKGHIEASESGENITFTCVMDEYTDGQTTTYTWQKYVNGNWVDAGTGQSITVSRRTDAGIPYRCYMYGEVQNGYALINEGYKAFLHRQGHTFEFKDWKDHLLNHQYGEYLSDIYTKFYCTPVNEAARLATEIVLSYEYLTKYDPDHHEYNTSVNGETVNGPKQLVVDCYRFLLQRQPSDAEVESWYSVYTRENWKEQPMSYPDGGGVNKDLMTYRGIMAVINGIASSDESALGMSQCYAYDPTKVHPQYGTTGMFLYTDSDYETRMAQGKGYTPSYTVPGISDAPATYTVTVNTDTGISSVSGGGQYHDY